MIKVAESTKSLAPEQYGSRKRHKAIDPAVSKALTFDILRQLKRAGVICSIDAKSCYDLIGHCEYTYILGALAKIHSRTQEGSKQTRGDSTYTAGY
jgi:hypothetical protein